MIAFFMVLGVVGLVMLVAGIFMDTYSDLDFGMIVLGLMMLVTGVFGAGLTGAYQADVNRCEKTIPQTTGKETKWLSGECYAKANDGKFVPLEWIEEGYDR